MFRSRRLLFVSSCNGGPTRPIVAGLLLEVPGQILATLAFVALH